MVGQKPHSGHDRAATTQSAAFNNTWAQFAGPANVTVRDNQQKLYYYQQGVGFYPTCAINSAFST
jgi:hypothetical protein